MQTLLHRAEHKTQHAARLTFHTLHRFRITSIGTVSPCIQA